jgi:hypothetical protein
MKSNYSALAGAKRLTWQGGLLIPVRTMTPVETQALEHKAREIFLTILRRFEAQHRDISPKTQSNNGAPHVFAGEPEAKELHKSHKVRKRLLREAMTYLFSINQIYQTKPRGHRYPILLPQAPLL